MHADFALLHAGLIRSGGAHGLCDAVGAVAQLVACLLEGHAVVVCRWWTKKAYSPRKGG